MDEVARLLDKLTKIEALHRGATSDGERIAAVEAHGRLMERLREAQRTRLTEWQFSMPDPWKRRLFKAICRKYEVECYRYVRQRYSTVMLQASDVFVNEVLWPEYEQISEVLGEYLDDLTSRVIRDVLGQDDSDVGVRGELTE